MYSKKHSKKQKLRHYQHLSMAIPRFQGKAKRSIDFLERMETNTTSPQVHKRSSRLSPKLIEIYWKSNAEKTCSQVQIQRQVSHLCKPQDAIRFMKSRLNSSLHKSAVLLLYIHDSLNYLDDPFLHHLVSNYQIQQC